MKKQLVIIGIVTIFFSVGFSGCVNEPEKLTQLSIITFNVEPTTIEQGKYANLTWTVTGATSISIDNGIGNVTPTGNLIIHPTQTTTYVLTVYNETSTKSALATITIISPLQYDQFAIGDCADVNYIGRYASNNTIFDSS